MASLFLSCLAVTCFILSCLVLSCLVLSCLVLSSLACSVWLNFFPFFLVVEFLVLFSSVVFVPPSPAHGCLQKVFGLTTSTGKTLNLLIDTPFKAEDWAEVLRDRVVPFLKKTFPQKKAFKILLDGEKIFHAPEAKRVMNAHKEIFLETLPERRLLFFLVYRCFVLSS